MIVLLIALGGQGPEGAAIAYSITAAASFATALISVHAVMRRFEASAETRTAAPESAP